jgi:hypothetical protein
MAGLIIGVVLFWMFVLFWITNTHIDTDTATILKAINDKAEK